MNGRREREREKERESEKERMREKIFLSPFLSFLSSLSLVVVGRDNVLSSRFVVIVVSDDVT